MKNMHSQQFTFSKRIKNILGLNYFDVNHMKNTEKSMCLSKDGAITKCTLLPEKLRDSCDFCYTVISNDWSTLDINGNSKIMDDFNYVN